MSNDMNDRQISDRLVLVTGPSGAGHSTAIRALEDMGYEAIDNLPLFLLPTLLAGTPSNRALAIGIDTRNRDFSATALIETIDQTKKDATAPLEVLYLDARREVLLRRFSETRRPHPLAPAENAAIGIARDFDLLAPIRARADILIDTSELTPHDLRAELENWFARSKSTGPAVTVQSFSYKRGLPRGLDMVFDVRFLKNPYWEPALRSGDGRDPAVGEFIAQDSNFSPLRDKVLDLILFMLPAQADEGKSYLSVGFGCTGGQHRSVFMAENLASALAENGWQVSIRHRELERHAHALQPPVKQE